MTNTKFVVKLNRVGRRTVEYVQRIDAIPLRTTPTLKLALVMGRFTAEDVIKSIASPRCKPELISVPVIAWHWSLVDVILRRTGSAVVSVRARLASEKRAAMQPQRDFELVAQLEDDLLMLEQHAKHVVSPLGRRLADGGERVAALQESARLFQ
jgi:hypothetical protein